MSTTTQQTAIPPTTGGSPGGWRSRVGQRPTVGVGPAGKQVADDLSALVKAEMALAKAELADGMKAKAAGAGAFAGAGVFGWLALQGLLITIGLALALLVPAWAAAGIVTVVLFLIAGIAALIGKKKLATPVSLDTTKSNVEEDVAWTKAHLPTR